MAGPWAFMEVIVPDAIVMEQVVKRFGTKTAVNGMNLRMPEGALYGFIGPNGAGKTTTIRMVMSILFPDSGRLSVLGKASATESKDRIGYLPEERGVYRKMKVASFLHHMGKLKGLSGPTLNTKVSDWLERVGLGDTAKKKCEELSKGMQQKVQFIAAVLHEPELIILDEPFSGLDPVNMRLLRDLIVEQHDQGRTLIFSTHVMQHAEELCDRIVMINQGNKVLDGTMDEIRQRHTARSILFEPIDVSTAKAAAMAVPGVLSVDPWEGKLEAQLHEDADPLVLMPMLLGAVPSRSIAVRRPTLEDIFVEVVLGDQTLSSDDESALRAELRGESQREPEEVAS
jgi:ABC-2 type transport system ATP-binding protein